ncbi:hypothetical protein NXC24_PA00288 (plasmid) [Rhizobium sp. NXC24]|nr:hypothetical protein NXC24_PA00288 [Rhizobium sp. NXC24]
MSPAIVIEGRSLRIAFREELLALAEVMGSLTPKLGKAQRDGKLNPPPLSQLKCWQCFSWRTCRPSFSHTFRG